MMLITLDSSISSPSTTPASAFGKIKKLNNLLFEKFPKNVFSHLRTV